MRKSQVLIYGIIIHFFTFSFVSAQDQAQELAEKLSNPAAALINVPFQNNTDFGIGHFNGTKNFLNFQPSIPFKLTSKYYIITRTIIPYIEQYNLTGDRTHQSGLGDITLRTFVSPADTKSSLIWGIGPAFSFPTAGDFYIGSGKFSLGASAVGLKQANGYTYGVLVSQLWSVAGPDDRNSVNVMLAQPFFAYNWKSGAGFSTAFELNQDWANSTTTGFLNMGVSGITRLGKLPISLSVGPRIPLFGPERVRPSLGIRSAVTFIFPKKK